MKAGAYQGQTKWFFNNWRDAPVYGDGDWPWPHFSARELACKGTGAVLVVRKALDALEDMRRHYGQPLTIVSGYRSPEHNKEVGGAKASKHMEGTAFDISSRPSQQEDMIAAALAAGFVGIGRYDHWIHVDLGPSRRWDERSRK